MLDKIIDCIKVWPLFVLPKHLLTGFIYRLTRIENKSWKNFLIKTFVSLYKVDLDQAIRTRAEDYKSFNDFFTRELKPEARKYNIDKNIIISPVDGAISQLGTIKEEQIIQAKGMDYNLSKLLANDVDSVGKFQNGTFATLYLSPRDYHRIHMPIDGKLIKSTYIPGDLFAVNTASVRTVNDLFARNERFVSLFQTDFGLMAQIMVGAIFVGSMETVWLGQITPTKRRELTIKDYKNEPVELKQGDEFGRFNMGSTVILLFQENKISWSNELKENDAIEVGQPLTTT